MTRTYINRVFICLCAVAGLAVTGHAQDNRFELRLSYEPAVQDIGDWYEESLEREFSNDYITLDYEVYVIPVGISLGYRHDMSRILDRAFLYGELGPSAILVGDASFWMVPFGGGVGYTINKDKPVAFTGKLGLRYPLAGGDYVEDNSIGFVAKAAVEFGGKDEIKFFVEAGYDSSSITFQDSFEEEEIDMSYSISIGVLL